MLSSILGYPAAVTTAGKLRGNPLEELINQVKGEYMHSLADQLAIKGRYIPIMVRSLTVSDLRKFDPAQVDMAMGRVEYGYCLPIPYPDSSTYSHTRTRHPTG